MIWLNFNVSNVRISYKMLILYEEIIISYHVQLFQNTVDSHYLDFAYLE